MEYTERELSIAKQLTEKETLAFIKKVFVDIHTENGEVVKQNIVALDDAEYGRLMKVLYLTRKENKAKLDLLKIIAKKKKKEEGKTSTVAPK